MVFPPKQNKLPRQNSLFPGYLLLLVFAENKALPTHSTILPHDNIDVRHA